jgi:hypothetical protein
MDDVNVGRAMFSPGVPVDAQSASEMFDRAQTNLVSALRCSASQSNQNCKASANGNNVRSRDLAQAANFGTSFVAGALKVGYSTFLNQKDNSSETASTRDVEGSNASGVPTVG